MATAYICVLLGLMVNPAQSATSAEAGSPARFSLHAGLLAPQPADDGGSGASSVLQESTPTQEEVVESAPDDSSPFSFEISYYLFSDYVFRGANYSEYANEGRENPNHQMTTLIGVDVAALLGGDSGSLGTFSFGTFFEWYAAQSQLDPEFGGRNLQEVDYSLSWAYDLEPIATTLTLGYNFYTFPKHKEINTSEWTVRLDHNDAWMWKWLWPDNEDGILNPYFMYVQDVEYAAGGKWAELGIQHDFQVMENLTLTPTFVIAAEHHYYSRTLKLPESGSGQLAYLQYGINAGYDLSSALAWPESVGSWTLAGFLYFNEAVGNNSENDIITDELFGGMSLTWAF